MKVLSKYSFSILLLINNGFVLMEAKPMISLPECWGEKNQTVKIENKNYEEILTGSVGGSGFFMLKMIKNESVGNLFYIISQRLETLKISTLEEYYNRHSQQIVKGSIRVIDNEINHNTVENTDVFNSSLITLNMSFPSSVPLKYGIFIWQYAERIFELEVTCFMYDDGPERECVQLIDTAVEAIIKQTLR